MKKSARYESSHLIENQFEPGSHNSVLRNKLSIKRISEMNRREKEGQLKAMEASIELFDADHRFTANDIKKIHKIWLGDIYEWAGKYRQVKISKGGFAFAFPEQIPKLMTELENGPLREYTPCHFSSIEEVVRALAVVHTELVLIHPFREGNGRVARMLATLMALQAGLPPLDFSAMAGKGKTSYIGAVQAGIARNYEPMMKIFTTVVRKTLKARGRQ